MAKGFPTVIIGDEGSKGMQAGASGSTTASTIELETAATPLRPGSNPVESLEPENDSVGQEAPGSLWSCLKKSALDLFDQAVFLVQLQLSFTLGFIVGFAVAFVFGVALLALAEFSVFAAVVAGLVLGAWALYGLYQLAREWPEMTANERAFAVGQIVGAVAGGYYSNSFFVRNIRPWVRTRFPKLRSWRLRELAWIRSFRTWLDSKFAAKRPSQTHHFATDKSKTYTPRMKKIADKYGLDLDEAWNKELLPHQGRHPNKYHDFVQRGMERAAREAGDDAGKFQKLFDKYVKQPVGQNPDLLRKFGWE